MVKYPGDCRRLSKRDATLLADVRWQRSAYRIVHDLMKRLVRGRLHRVCKTCVSVVAVVARPHEKGASASAGLPDGFRGIHECEWAEVMYLVLRYNHSSECV